MEIALGRALARDGDHVISRVDPGDERPARRRELCRHARAAADVEISCAGANGSARQRGVVYGPYGTFLDVSPVAGSCAPQPTVDRRTLRFQFHVFGSPGLN